MDIIIGKRGDSLKGKVLNKHFEMSSVFGPVRVKTVKIAWIHLDTTSKTDEMWLHNGDRLTGRLRQKVVDFKPEAGERRRISRKVIHTIVLGTGFAKKGQSL
jgi:hypothetical protein